MRRHQPVIIVAEPQLAVAIGPPGKDSPTDGGHDGVVSPAGQSGQRHPSQAVHQRGAEHHVELVAQPQLALAVAAPGEELAGGGKSGAVVHASGHGGHFERPEGLDEPRHSQSGRTLVVTQLAILVTTPTVRELMILAP